MCEFNLSELPTFNGLQSLVNGFLGIVCAREKRFVLTSSIVF